MPILTLGYSPCPNDTFIFYSLVHGKIPLDDLMFRVQLEDVETLNHLALEARLDVTKVSFHALGFVRREYALLRSGSALGRGCGPLLVGCEFMAPEEIKKDKVAIPGIYTTAHLLLKLYLGRDTQTIAMPFHKIIDAVKKGDCKAGVIIHEGRFTYQGHGLKRILDLGEWWENTTGLPIPLGGIVVRRTLGFDMIRRLERLVRESVVYALTHSEEPRDYMRVHAQELDEGVIKQHIDLYVNSFSLELGVEGQKAVEHLFKLAERQGLLPKSSGFLFIG